MLEKETPSSVATEASLTMTPPPYPWMGQSASLTDPPRTVRADPPHADTQPPPMAEQRRKALSETLTEAPKVAEMAPP